jgi:hypothetical protein
MSKQLRPHSPLVPVHKTRKPCPVCGKRDNCAVSDAGTYCRRVRSEHQGSDGGWWHPNDEADSMPARPAAPVIKPGPSSSPLADRVTRDLVYQAFLRALPLLPDHRQNLQARGLEELSITRARFKSTPTEEEAARIAAGIAEDCDLAGVPGFYKDRSGWRLVKIPSGFLIPVLDRQGLIQSLQIRCDYLKHPKDARYKWLSSRGYPLGTSSGAPVHVQNPERIASTGRCIITEGALKSLIASRYLSPSEGGLIALAGVGTFNERFGAQISSVWPGLHTAVVAFDNDWREKREVKAQLHRLARSLKAASLHVEIRTWEHEKGIDDYLVAEALEASEVAVA